MHDFEEDRYKVSRSYLSMNERGAGGWREGHFQHPEGLVRVFEARIPRFAMTSMFFIRQGHSHQRRWNTVWGDKTLARLAREFVEDVCQSM